MPKKTVDCVEAVRAMWPNDDFTRVTGSTTYKTSSTQHPSTTSS